MNRKLFFWSAIFAISMGFFESAVVVYLRTIAYPGGFSFPLQPLSTDLSTTELLREGFSLVMLFSVSCLLAKRGMERFGWFIYNFAIWDIFYYIFLYLLIGWPQSPGTMDVLFMIPVVWTGPVYAPVILSLLMILLAVPIINYSQRIRYIRFRTKEFLLLLLGSLICILSFTFDSIKFLQGSASGKFVPGPFNWIVFTVGALIILIGTLMFIFHNKKSRKKK
jgi:hypothetical protein